MCASREFFAGNFKATFFFLSVVSHQRLLMEIRFSSLVSCDVAFDALAEITDILSGFSTKERTYFSSP